MLEVVNRKAKLIAPIAALSTTLTFGCRGKNSYVSPPAVGQLRDTVASELLMLDADKRVLFCDEYNLAELMNIDFRTSSKWIYVGTIRDDGERLVVEIRVSEVNPNLSLVRGGESRSAMFELDKTARCWRFIGKHR